jgi:peroxiredoxin
MKTASILVIASIGLATLLACDKQNEAAPKAATSAAAPVSAAAEAPKKPEGEVKTTAAPATTDTKGPTVGAPAPDFALKDLDGNEVKLSGLKGKTVVLEWFNPECPFVKNSHAKGSLAGLAEKYAKEKDLVWLAINSGGEGRQGFGAEVNKAAVTKFGLKHAVLLDESGEVGKAYGATNTPHMFIVDKEGKLVYKGAIDNSPDGEGASPTDGKLVNYVAQALEELAAGKPVTVAETKAYGCGVKYAKN